MFSLRLATTAQLGEALGRRAPVQGLSRTAIQLGGDRIELYLRERGEITALGEILPQQPVGVLAAPALPRTVRIAEVHRRSAIDGERVCSVAARRASSVPCFPFL